MCPKKIGKNLKKIIYQIPYFIPCIMVSSFFRIKNKITAAIIDMTTNIMKNAVKPSIGIPNKNGVGRVGSG
jgi:hypothetical protein